MPRRSKITRYNFEPSIKELKRFARILYKRDLGIQGDLIVWATKRIEELEKSIVPNVNQTPPSNASEQRKDK